MKEEIHGKEIHGNNVSESADIINLSDYFNKILFHWPLYLLATLVSLFSGYIYLRYSKPMYSSSAKIYIKDSKKGGMDMSAFKDLSGFSDSKVVENEMELLRSPLILQEVIRNGKFNIHYYYKGRVSLNEMYENCPIKVNILTDSSNVGNANFNVEILENQRLKVSYNIPSQKDKVRSFSINNNEAFFINKDKISVTYNPAYRVDFSKNFHVAIDSILQLSYSKANEVVTTNVARQATVIQLSYKDGIAKRSADFLNELLKTYNKYTLDDKNRSILNTIEFIDTRLSSLGGELSTLEGDVETFKKTRGITEISENSRLYLEQVKDADQELSRANLELSVYDEVEKYINNPRNSAPFTPVYGNVDPSLSSMITRYEELLHEKQRLSLSLKESSPQQQNLDIQIADARNTIKNYTAGFRRNAITARSGLQRKVNQIEGLISNIPQYERQYITIKRQQGVKEQLYLYLLQKKEESSLAYASNIIDNKIISPAFIPEAPISPKRSLVYLGFIGVGLVLTTIYIAIKYLSNNTVTSKKDIEKVSALPVIAEIFKEDVAGTKNVISNERSVLREQILNLRNNLKFLLAEVKDSPVILFTSSISGEGKTFLSSHLASALTYNDKRVVLLELDLRKPKLSQSLGVSNNSGFTNYIIGAETLDQVIKKVPNTERLFVIPSGPIPPNPIELLETEKMSSLIATLKERFDYIIIDTSPVGLVSDAKSLSPFVDYALFVIRFNYTPQGKLREISNNLGSGLFKRVGIILNGIEKESSYAYYGYGYSSSKYGYGYGDTETAGSGLKEFGRRLRSRLS